MKDSDIDLILAKLQQLDDKIARLSRRLNRTLNRVIARGRLDDVDDRHEIAPRPPGDWICLKQGEAELGRKLSTLYDLRKSGAVPQLKEGGRVLVERSAIAAVVAASHVNLKFAA
jgi:hypothetical protein